MYQFFGWIGMLAIFTSLADIAGLPNYSSEVYSFRGKKLGHCDWYQSFPAHHRLCCRLFQFSILKKLYKNTLKR
jgi:hypothetical protein